MTKTKENKIITESRGTQVAPKQTPAEKEAAKKSENEEPAGAPAPRELLKKGKPAEEGAPVKSNSNSDAEADLNRQNSEETSPDPSQNRNSNTEYGKGL